MRHDSSNLLMNIYGKKQIVYWVQTFGIWSLFVSIWLKINWIVCDRLNIAVTWLGVSTIAKQRKFNDKIIRNGKL
jgi:hypothetical protein